jgi:hypothetical protein
MLKMKLMNLIEFIKKDNFQEKNLYGNYEIIKKFIVKHQIMLLT